MIFNSTSPVIKKKLAEEAQARSEEDERLAGLIQDAKDDSITGLSVSGTTITYTKGDNATGTITTQDTTYSNATPTVAGLMSAADKQKLDTVIEGAKPITIESSVLEHSENPVQSKAIFNELKNKSNVGHNHDDRYYTEAEINSMLAEYALKTDMASAVEWKGTVAKVSALPTGAETGDMWHVTEKSAEYVWNGSAWEEVGSIVDLSNYYTKKEVDDILEDYYTKDECDEEFATKVEHNALSGTVTALSGTVDTKVDKVTGKGLSTNDFTNDLKAKLESVDFDANKTEVDKALSSTSEWPVQNKVVKAALDTKANSADFILSKSTVTLSATKWSSKSQSVTITGMTADILVFVEPVDSSEEIWFDCGLRASSQALNTLTFACETVPESDISVKVAFLDF